MNRLKTATLAFLSASGFYLYALPAATLVFMGVVLAHVALGFLFSAVLLPEVLRVRRQKAVLLIGKLVLAAGAVTGLILVFTGAAGPYRPLLSLHIVSCLVGVVVVVTDWTGGRGWLPRSGIPGRLALLTLAAAMLAGMAWGIRVIPWQTQNRIVNPGLPPDSMDGEGGGPRGPFFPSSIRTSHDDALIPSEFFMQSEACQRCHEDIYGQWESSVHHFSSFNNQWYRKSIEYMQDVIGTKPSRWCAGCHDPALFLSGMFDTPMRELVDRPEAHAGMGCVACHSVSAVKSTMGQGDLVMEYPPLAKLAASENKVVQALHDFLVYVNPEPHRRTFMKPFIRNQSAEFCSTCHKVHMDGPVNNYRWVRGFNEYDSWQASAASGQGARSFYYPPKPSRCVDCHMPMVSSDDAGNIKGQVHSHRFPAANTAIPFVNKDAEQFDTVRQFLEDKILTVDIFGISPARAQTAGLQMKPGELSTTFAVGEEAETEVAPADVELAPLTAPLDRVGATVRNGDTYRVDVVVRTRKIGHFFPAGTVDAFDVWLELQATDENGRVLYWSGLVEDGGKGPVEKGAHFYRSLQLDAAGNVIDKRNAWSTRTVAYVRLIPPGSADTVHYRIRIPDDATGKIRLKARLHYRKFAWWNTQFSFAGERPPGSPEATPHYDNARYAFTADTSKVSGKIKAIPNLPIITLGESEAFLNVLPKNDAEPPAVTKLEASDWERWNDYGIGLFLQGDLKGAEAAFTKATVIEPANPDGWVNIGRVRVQEGNLDGACKVLERALQLSPNLARAHFFYAKALRGGGEYDRALAHLRRVLAQYPRDRVARNDAGRILFLQKKYREAVREFESVLAIDPEDLQAHYNSMLCYNGLGDLTRAEEHQKRYLRFKADESAQAITGPYRMSHPDDNNERQAIHEHVSALFEKVKK